ncbi:putative tail fiber repeat family protein [Cronobacter phage S13]|uniref:putative tail fiber repeat family protein n=1 Tax=Cronobacter phage S13 TaxID=1327935 RepID=UPI00049AD814|nr:putative tail fiber repeat family protein [Cronobacter phage S13]AIA64892.1 putative tail fiber repeat family protein [Cronobacter phage S13]
MIKISQMPLAGKYKGNEIFPIVQDGDTVQASPLFTDSELKVHVPENAAIVTEVEGTEINLMSAKVVDGVVTVFIGDKEVSLYKDSSIIVTEGVIEDGNLYSRINNKWVIRNSVTQINNVSAPTGGGKVEITAHDVGAHVDNENRDGVSYISRDGVWIPLATGMQVELDKKADKVHTHEISDVNGLTTRLDTLQTNIDQKTHEMTDINGLTDALDSKAEKVHNHAISDVTGLDTRLSVIESKDVELKGEIDTKAEKIHNHEIASINGLKTRLENIESKADGAQDSIDKIETRLITAMFYSVDEPKRTTSAGESLPITMKTGVKTSVADGVISFEEAGFYFIQLIANIQTGDTVVKLEGVEGMSVEGQGNLTVSGIFDISESTKLSLKDMNGEATIATSLTIHKI